MRAARLLSLLILTIVVLTSVAVAAQPTPVPPAEYTVQRGDTLAAIARRYGTTVNDLMQVNNLSDPDLIFAGQVLQLSLTPGNLPPSPAADVTSRPSGQFGFGLVVYPLGTDFTLVVEQVTQIGVSWVKLPIFWRDLEPQPGQTDFAALDSAVEVLSAAGRRILLSVSGAPEWSRTFKLENGPPDDPSQFNAILAALATRYAGKVQAYEIWSEPNRRAEWSCSEAPDRPRFCEFAYSELLQGAYQTLKSADPTLTVVSAGLAPTGYNDGVNAIADRDFLRGLYAAGLRDFSDAIGVHPFGWANPPGALCCAQSEGVSSHYENVTFYFRNTIEDYRRIMLENQDSETVLWITGFGWGSSEDSAEPAASYRFVADTSLAEQGLYTARAFVQGAGYDYVGPMFLENLNGCAVGTAEMCYYSLLGPDGLPRPVFESLQTTIRAASGG